MPVSRKPVTPQQALAALNGGEELTARLLSGFNDLGDDTVAEFMLAWAKLAPQRRVELVRSLALLAMEDLKVNFEAIFRALVGDKDADVRLAAVEGLSEDETPALVSVFIERVNKDPDPRVAAAAARSLGHFVVLAETDKLNPRWRDQIYGALNHMLLHAPEASLMHCAALESIGYFSNDTVAMHIRAAFASDDEALRCSSIIAMGRNANPRFREFVREELQSVSPEIRLQAALASGELEDDDAVKTLALLLEDTDLRVRDAALESLARIGGDDARKLIQAAILSEDEGLSKAAEGAKEQYDFWHGEIDLSMAKFDEEDLKPRRVWQKK